MTTPVTVPDLSGHFGPYGGRFVPEALIAALDDLTDAFHAAQADPDFAAELSRLLRDYAGRPSPLTDVPKFGEQAGGARVLLKREDLNHTGSHKINNVLGQALLTQRIGKKRVIAETGAGQHGVATATAAALMGLECTVYMGAEDTRRQALNVARMQLLGAEVDTGDDRLAHAQGRDQRGDARLGHQRRDDELRLRHGGRAASVPDDGARVPADHRRRGARAGARTGRPPARRRDRLRRRRLERHRDLHGVPGPTRASGSSDTRQVVTASRPAATRRPSAPGRRGVLHGARSYLLQDANGQTLESHSISAGLDYPGVGPEHSYLHDTGRAEYHPITDAEAMDAFALLCRTEGIIPAIESAHALAGTLEARPRTRPRRRDPGEPLRPW